MKKLCLPIAAIALLLPVSALAEPGELDRGFGSRGLVTTPVRLDESWKRAKIQLAEGPDGHVFVAAAGKVVRYLPDGQLDSEFAAGGVQRILLPEGRRLEILDLAADSHGRAVVIGTARRPLGGSPWMRRSVATVVRMLPDGELDPDFGGGDGVATASMAAATLGMVDSEDRIVLVAETVERRASCGGPPRPRRRDVIVRLTAEGRPDREFGDAGVAKVGSLETISALALGGGDSLVAAGTPRGSCRAGRQMGVSRLREDGSVIRSFARRGMRRLTGSAASVAVDLRGRIVVVCEPRQTTVRDEQATKLLRLLPDGRWDPEFGGGWIVYRIKGPVATWSTLAIRAADRPILVGTLIKRQRSERDDRFHHWFLAVPLRESGDLEGNVSWRGWAWITRFNPTADAVASEGLIDSQGRLVIAGTARRLQSTPKNGFVLVRMELR